MFDFAKMFGGAGGGMSNMFAKPQGWGATVTPADSFLSRDAATGGVTGINGTKMGAFAAAAAKGAGAGVGKGLGGFAAGAEVGSDQAQAQMAPPPDPNQDPNIQNAQKYMAMLARRKQGVA